VGLREEELVGEAGGVEMQQGEELLGENCFYTFIYYFIIIIFI
jgi:hypothetical protein